MFLWIIYNTGKHISLILLKNTIEDDKFMDILKYLKELKTA